MEKFWLQHYPSDMPATIDPTAYASLNELFEESCRRFYNKPALSNFGHKLTYGELEQYSRYFASFLQEELKLAKGERVAIMLPNVLQYPIVFFGILKAGLVAVNVNPLYTPPEISHQLKDAGATTIIVLANFAHALEKALPLTSVQHVIVTEIGDMMGWFKSRLINFVIKRLKKLVPQWNIAKAITFRQALSSGKQQDFQPRIITGDDLALLQYTGGTTGVAKGAMLSHKNMIANVLQTEIWVAKALRAGEEVAVTALPLYHIFSLTICCLVFLKVGAMSLLITNPRDIPGFIKTLRKNNFSIFVGVNTLFNALLNNLDFTKLDFSHLRLGVAGGMALQSKVAARWQEVTGNKILEGYGLTESSPVVTINPLIATSDFTGSIGMPIPATDISIRDDAGNEVAIGEIGELCIKGPQVMQGYWQNLVETQKAFTKDGWLKTGDMVRFDNNGLIYLVDRKKDLILVSGFNVYPNEVEDVIASHPDVLEVGVIGVPNLGSGEAVKAFIVKKNPDLSEQDIKNYCHERLTRYKMPKFIEFRAALPKSNVGKILRRQLREEELRAQQDLTTLHDIKYDSAIS